MVPLAQLLSYISIMFWNLDHHQVSHPWEPGPFGPIYIFTRQKGHVLSSLADAPANFLDRLRLFQLSLEKSTHPCACPLDLIT